MVTAKIFAGLLGIACGQAAQPGAPPPPAPSGPAAPATQPAPAVTAATAASALDFTMLDLAGQPVPLSRYRGKAVLIVNVASRCGYTPQYEQLQKLHDEYAERGLAILAFPCNDFGKQEPGTPAEIREFCTSKYGVKFDLFDKVAVKGEQRCALYEFLTSPRRGESLSGDVKWNFTKFLLDRSGKLIARFEPATRPDDRPIVEAIERALAVKP